jgi:hypothetical protein
MFLNEHATVNSPTHSLIFSTTIISHISKIPLDVPLDAEKPLQTTHHIVGNKFQLSFLQANNICLPLYFKKKNE